MSSILDEILTKKREEVAWLRANIHNDARFDERWSERLARRSDLIHPRAFRDVLRRSAGAPVRVIAEIKRASPSAGAIRPGADPVAIASEYAEAGAAALSVLTDRTFFDGDLAFVMDCREAVPLPVLRKDFVIDEIQVLESRRAGADAVLLIAAALSSAELHRMMDRTQALHMDALVEVHSVEELDVALSAPRPPALIGVNHRDLATFQIDMSLTEQIAKRVPPDVVLVAESGIRTRDDIRRLGDAGAHAVLVGEQLMRAPSPGAALRELLA